MKLRRVATAIAASAFLMLPATAALAAPPTALQAPTLNHVGFPWTPGADGQDHYRVAGSGCIDVERNLPGVVTVTLTEGDGTVQTTTVNADAAGQWTAYLGGSTAFAGTATAAATCDVYNTAVPYPVASLQIGSPPASLAPLEVALTSDDDTADVVISGTGCVASNGKPGLVSHAVVLPDGSTVYDFVDAKADGSWSVTYDGNLGNYEFEAVCHVFGHAVEYDPIAFEVYDTATGPSTSNVSTPATPSGQQTGTPVSTSTARGPQLAATGTHTATLAWTAVSLLGAGVLLSAVGRRRIS